jgi:hypothetical protein
LEAQILIVSVPAETPPTVNIDPLILADAIAEFKLLEIEYVPAPEMLIV